ncbi:phosphate transporter [Cantharellus anzutake]|uniref:phosphate transporter n=1 Tax=Cantharellus anzutake TaxID=1750568 RepID=UPI00190857F6|nr:phosphate transporter [Cantharellus anzutake]KAF8339844.1 phosphate transporter [Cantharellus anzutake]
MAEVERISSSSIENKEIQPATTRPIANPTAVQTIDERRRQALAEIDNAKFGWFHLRTCIVAGIGFLTDAYDLFAINIGASMIGYVYAKGGALNVNQDLGLKVAAPIGTLTGQLLFGWLADILGRKRMYGIELIIIIIGTFAQALSGQGPAVNILGTLIVWRFLMGIGIGGDYPLSAVITSEFAGSRMRGRMMTAVFANQGWGQLGGGIVGLVVVQAYKNKILSGPATGAPNVDYCWRLLIGLGCVPGVIALYFRLTIPETPRFTMDIERNVQQASQDVETFFSSGRYFVDEDAVVQKVEAPRMGWSDFVQYFRKWENGKVLFGTSYSWFALDIAFYGLGLNSAVILTAIGYGSLSKSDAAKHGHAFAVYQNLHNICVGNIILSVAGLIPGYWVAFFLIDRIGRKPIQLMGFIVLTIIFCAMGFGYDRMVNHGAKSAFVALYCLANFFQNFGPNTTTFVIPGEIFPTRYRSTGHGISAASGKLGAIVAQVGFSRLKDIGGPNAFVKHILEIFAFFMMTGIFSTLLIPETMGRTLEDLSNEPQQGFVRGVKTTTVDQSGLIQMGTR